MNQTLLRLTLTTFLLLPATILLAADTTPETLVGKVVEVTDGDTLKLLVDEKQHTIRLDGIDAPEGKQPGGDQSTEALSKMVLDKTVKVLVRGTDRYG